MANFLDLTTGLPALWAKIKSKFYTKAEVDAAIPSASSTSPEMDGTAVVGVSTAYARADHVHPTDTSRAAVADVLTKTNTTSYTPTADYHPATKAYVDAATAGVSPNLSGLTDTTISSPTEGQVLSYDSTTSKWINTTLPAGITETRVNELIAAALAQYGDGDTATYGYNDASEVNY